MRDWRDDFDRYVVRDEEPSPPDYDRDEWLDDEDGPPLDEEAEGD